MLNFGKGGFPTLQKREDNLKKFSTYIEIRSQNNQLTLKWQKQPSLEKNLELYKEKHQEFSNLFCQEDKGRCILYFFLKIAVDKSQSIAAWEPVNRIQLAFEHLASYFEERCYWAIKDLCKNCLTNEIEEYLCEYLCIARLLLHEQSSLRKILLGYDPNKEGNLETYISRVITNQIKSSTKVNRFSRWRLLCKTSDSELRKALEVFGILEPRISQFIFARQYFKQVYLDNKIYNPARTKGQKWPDPDGEDFEQAARCYNAERLLPMVPYEVSANSIQVTANQIKNWMKDCIQVLVNFQNRTSSPRSIDEQQFEPLKTELVSEDNPADPREVQWQQLLNLEEIIGNRECLINRVNSALTEQLQTMKPNHQEILRLYYGFNLNQNQIAARLGVGQPTISRNLDRAKLQLLNAVAKISQPQQWEQQCVEEWLQRGCRTPLYPDLIQAVLVSAIKKLTSEEREILQLYYGQQMNENQISSHLAIHLDEVTRRLTGIRNELQNKLLSEIEIWREKYLDTWLRDYFRSSETNNEI